MPERYYLRILKSVVLVALLTTTSLATQLALHPLYGSTSTSLYHARIMLVGCFASMLLPRIPERHTILALATWLAYAPHATYVLGVWTTRQWRNPTQGAAAVQAAVLVPVLSTSVALIRQWNTRLEYYVNGPLMLRAYAALTLFNCLNYVAPFLHRNLPLGGLIHSSNMFAAAAAGLTLLAAITSSSAPPAPPQPKGKGKGKIPQPRWRKSKHVLPLLFPVFAAAFAFSRPPAVSPSLPLTRQTTPAPANASSAPPATVRLLARAHGPTGLVAVGEHVEEEFRFLRVDHSILGGRWYGEKVAPDARDGLGDSIYSAFVLQEAARLVKRAPPENERALIIGLGVGVAAEAFIAHGVNTTVVEIDQAVYTYAREFFGLPEPAHVYLEDARGWVQQHTGDKFDYVVHDCFSGGGVPEHLYTVEFWAELQDIVTPDGVVAVNFAGQMGSDAARAIHLTLQRSFGTCRAFHDQINAKLDPEYSFFNIVFFCTAKGMAPPKFRKAVEADFLVSHLRLHVLSALGDREMNASMILGNASYVSETAELAEEEEKWVLRDSANSLGEWQRESAVEHWEVMREVLPDVFWETY